MPELPEMAVVAADLQRQTDAQGRITVALDPYMAFCVIAQIQLASRHPENTGRSLEVACQFAAELAKGLPESARQVVAAGWSPENDVDVDAETGTADDRFPL